MERPFGAWNKINFRAFRMFRSFNNRVCALGGNLLLNLGPNQDGLIPDCMIEPLLAAQEFLGRKSVE